MGGIAGMDPALHAAHGPTGIEGIIMRHALITIHLLNQAHDGATAQAELAVEEPVTRRLAVMFGGLAVAI
jgi:hypothetical protein